MSELRQDQASEHSANKRSLNAGQRIGRVALGALEITGGLVTQGLSVVNVVYAPQFAVPAFLAAFALECRGGRHIAEGFIGQVKPAHEYSTGATRAVMGAFEVAGGAAEIALGVMAVATGIPPVEAIGLAAIGSGVASIGEAYSTMTYNNSPVPVEA